MIAALIRWSLKDRLFVLAAALLLLGYGVYRTLEMPVDVFPDLTAPTVTVLAEAPGLAPTEMETLVTIPIEAALNGSSGVRRIRSSTGIGSAIVWAEFDWGTDIYQARQIVAEKLQTARASLPPEMPAPALAPVASIMGEVMFIALRSAEGSGHDLMSLKTVADWGLRRQLLAVPGVAQVVTTGGETRQYQVLVDPVKLANYRIGLDQVSAALAETNENTSAGFLVENGQEYLIYGLGRVHSPDDIAGTVVDLRDGVPVRIADLAEVRIGPAVQRGTASAKGYPAVVLAIQKQPGANTLDLTERLDAVLAELQAGLPAGMVIETKLFRQAGFIRLAVANVEAALRDGALLVVIIVFAFLWSLSATAITVLAIPLSLLAAVLVLEAMGASINTMTLGGMAIAVGALVDDAIIDVENIARRLREDGARPPQERRGPLRVVFDATHEIQSSIVFATLIIILVFLPLFFLSGVEGRLLQPLGLAYVVALAASLLVAITVTPVLCFYLLPRTPLVRKGREPRVVVLLKRLYAPMLARTLSRWRPVAAVSLMLLAVALAALSQAGQTFLPPFNEGSLTILANTPPGTSLAQSDALAAQLEEALIEQPEVVGTARRTGRSELAEHSQEVNSTEIEVTLDLKGKGSGRDMEALLTELRGRLARVPGMSVTIGQPISHRVDHMLSGTRASIAVKVFGDDLYELRRIAKAIESQAAEVPGVVDLMVDQQADIPFVTVSIRRDAIARHGLRVRDVAETIETAFYGRVLSRVLEGQTSFDLVLRYPDGAREDIAAVRETLVTTASGARLPLHALAEVRRDRGPNTVSRENVQRKIVVSANVAGRDLRSVVDDIRAAVADSVDLPRGYRVEYGGQFESAEQATRTLVILGSGVVVGIFLLLYVAFRSGRDAALVMLNLPLALIGGVVGVFAAGGVVSVASLVGFITLFGIATRNGVMLIAHIRHLVEVEGVADFREAVHRGAMERLAPILMTALAAGLALVPLALAGGEPGSEIQTPMAIVILWGLLSSTALNMVVVPALYLRFGAARTSGSEANAGVRTPASRNAPMPS
ncbi:MAG TPA: efflux RND transporter permease subunit [Chromatiaceae bacterium]|nr:efflux RND transporter permease subunit [Chromatiaceae bacterium]